MSKGVYIDAHVQIGSCVKIQNHVPVFEEVALDDRVFVNISYRWRLDYRNRHNRPSDAAGLSAEMSYYFTPALKKPRE